MDLSRFPEAIQYSGEAKRVRAEQAAKEQGVGATSALQTSPGAAEAFLADFGGHDAHLATIKGKSAPVGHRGDDALATVQKLNADGANVYFHVNRAKAGVTKKAAKSDMEGIRAIPFDVDPPKGMEWGAAQAALAERRKGLEGCELPPTVILSSGGGLQAFWSLSTELAATTETVARVEAVGKAIADRFGGDPVYTVDRIMRLPGFVNWPKPDKAARGQVPAVAEVIGGSRRTCTLAELEAAFAPAVGGNAAPASTCAGGPGVAAANAGLAAGIAHDLNEVRDVLTWLAKQPGQPLGLGNYNKGEINWRNSVEFALTDMSIRQRELAPDIRALFDELVVLAGRNPADCADRFERELRSTAERIAEGKETRSILSVFKAAPAMGWQGGSGAAQGASQDGTGAADNLQFEFMLPPAFDPSRMMPNGRFGVFSSLTEFVLESSLYPQPVFALGAALMAASALIGARASIPASQGLRLNVYVCNVGDTTSGKGAPLAATARLFHEVGRTYFAQLASAAALQDRIFDDPGAPQILDEASSQFAQLNAGSKNTNHSGLLELILDLFSKSNAHYVERAFARDRKAKVHIPPPGGIGASAAPGTYQPRSLSNPYLSALWTSTPTALADALKASNAGAGVLNRLLYFVTDDHAPRRRKGGAFVPAVPPGVLVWYGLLAQRATVDIDISTEVQTALDDDKLRDAMLRWAAKKQQSQLARDVSARVTEYALKIAGILAVCRDPQHPVIEHDAFFYAVRLAVWCVQRLFDFTANSIADTPEEITIRRVTVLLRKQMQDDLRNEKLAPECGWVRHRDALKASKVLAPRFNEVCETMLSSGSIEMAETSTTSAGGRPGRVYRLRASS